MLAVGRKADLSVIDFDDLEIQAPYVRSDLPIGASRVLQPSTGCLATMVNGRLVAAMTRTTGDRPGRLLHSVVGAACLKG